MKIVLVTGMSTSGKTSICKNLCERYPEKYNFIQSYTDRQKREKDEWGHTFVDSKEMDTLLNKENIVAKTTIDKNRYCSLEEQFDKNKINLYTVDSYGIDDAIKFFPPETLFLSVLVRRNEVEADCVRINRDVSVPIRDDVDFLINNNGTIESSANLLNSIVNFDFFYPAKTQYQTLNYKLDYIDMQSRFLDEIKESLYEQMWYQNQKIYKNLCAYVKEKINKDFDFDIDIIPDSSPEIFDGYLAYNLQAQYDDAELAWDEINRIVEKLSHYAYEFGKEHDCDDIIYRLAVSEYWTGEDKYL